jgi:hypothetical protein
MDAMARYSAAYQSKLAGKFFGSVVMYSLLLYARRIVFSPSRWCVRYELGEGGGVKLREDVTVFPLKSLCESARSKPEPLDAQVQVRVERLEHEAAHDLECGPTITGAVFLPTDKHSIG